MSKKSVFIDRSEIRNLILKIGNGQWTSFYASELIRVGIQHRCNISADGKDAILDFYFNENGTTTISSTGRNKDISLKIKEKLEESCVFKNIENGKTYSFKNLPIEWSKNLIEFLQTLVDNSSGLKKYEKMSTHDLYKFKSNLGDTLVVNVYTNGTITLQGKPAYLFSEAISFLSYYDGISVDNIVDTINTLHEVDIKPDDVRSEIEILLPYSHNKLDEMILKLLSPSISLRKLNIPLEDYSCYAFPILRALEGYIKYLFGIKNIQVGNGFHGKFKNGVLATEIDNRINDKNFKDEIEKLYDYLTNNRHVIFHAEQVLIGTKILEDKNEADTIVDSVLELIENSCKKLQL